MDDAISHVISPSNRERLHHSIIRNAHVEDSIELRSSVLLQNKERDKRTKSSTADPVIALTSYLVSDKSSPPPLLKRRPQEAFHDTENDNSNNNSSNQPPNSIFSGSNSEGMLSRWVGVVSCITYSLFSMNM